MAERATEPMTDALRLRTLAAMRATLLHAILPELASNAGITAGHVLLRLIDHWIADATPQPADAIDPAMASAWQRLSPRDPAEALAATELETVLPGLLCAPDGDANDFLQRFVAWQTAQLVARDPEAAGGVGQMYRGGKTAKAEAPAAEVVDETVMSPERLTGYLRARFPDQADVEVTGLTILPGGFSKQTIMVATRQCAAPRRFVLRKDFAISPAERTVTSEFALLNAVWDAGGIAIPQPLWLESDPARLGTAAMAVALVEGSGDYAGLLADPAQARLFARDLAGSLARLHALPPTAIAGAAPALPMHAHVATEIDRWYGDFRRWKTEPRPMLEAVYAWLRANIPDTSCAPTIVHGDVGFHNMLLEDGRLKALLDWEFAHVGDPAEDLVYCRFFVEQVIDWEEFLDLYAAEGGQRPSAAAEIFYGVWAGARNAAGCAGARYHFLTEPRADAKLGVSGLTFLPRFELDAMARIVASRA